MDDRFSIIRHDCVVQLISYIFYQRYIVICEFVLHMIDVFCKKSPGDKVSVRYLHASFIL